MSEKIAKKVRKTARKYTRAYEAYILRQPFKVRLRHAFRIIMRLPELERKK